MSCKSKIISPRSARRTRSEIIHSPKENKDGWFENAASLRRRAYGLYHNVNLYNTLLMACSLLDPEIAKSAGRDCSSDRRRWQELAVRIGDVLTSKYVDKESGCYYADYEEMADGTWKFIRFTDRNPEPDYWEYVWAVTTGPFFPDLAVAVRSAKMACKAWPEMKSYGYCPWNTAVRFLKNLGVIGSEETAGMLADEIEDARTESKRFPMRNALTEYRGAREGWRPLPFSAGSFLQLSSSLLLQALPAGLAVRASDLADSIGNFEWRSSEIDVQAECEGDFVGAWSLNGETVAGSLQIPENLILPGKNILKIRRSSVQPEELLLHESDAVLVRVENNGGSSKYFFRGMIPATLLFKAPKTKCRFEANDSCGDQLRLETIYVAEAGMLAVKITPAGPFFTCTVTLDP